MWHIYIFLIYIKYLKRTPLFENLGIHKQRNQIIAISINIKQINGKTSKLYKNNLSISKLIKINFTCRSYLLIRNADFWCVCFSYPILRYSYYVYYDSDLLILEFKFMRNVQTTFYNWQIYEIIFETIM